MGDSTPATNAHIDLLRDEVEELREQLKTTTTALIRLAEAVKGMGDEVRQLPGMTQVAGAWTDIDAITYEILEGGR